MFFTRISIVKLTTYCPSEYLTFNIENELFTSTEVIGAYFIQEISFKLQR